MTPSNGATIFSKRDSSRSRCRLACAACTAASPRRRRSIFSSASCLRDRIGVAQIAPALGGDLRDASGSPAALASSACACAQLLIDFGRLDLREQLPGLDRRADVDEPALEIAVRARVDRRLVVAPARCRAGPGRGRPLGAPWAARPCTGSTACASVYFLQARVRAVARHDAPGHEHERRRCRDITGTSARSPRDAESRRPTDVLGVEVHSCRRLLAGAAASLARDRAAG